jgi:hypothetical protein
MSSLFKREFSSLSAATFAANNYSRFERTCVYVVRRKGGFWGDERCFAVTPCGSVASWDKLVLIFDCMERKPITKEQRAAYRAGECRFNVPPVCHNLWTEDDWIRYVQFNDASLNATPDQYPHNAGGF